MQIKGRLFSYPILNENTFLSTYNNKSIELIFTVDENDDYFILKNLHYKCNSEYLLAKIKNNEVAVECIIECSSTIYKATYLITEQEKDICLLKNDLEGKVEISLIAYATEELILESSNEFDEDYRNINFNISKSQILAFDDRFSSQIIHRESSDNLAHSIFSIIRNEMSESMLYEISIKTNKIEISLARDIYNKYLKVYDIDDFTNEFFCSLLVPALSEGLHECLKTASNACDIEIISEKYNWFISIMDAYKRLHGCDLNLEKFKDYKMNALAQELLGFPIGKALDEINKKVNMVAEDE